MSLYDLAVPTFIRTLTSLKAILKKAEEHVNEKKLDPLALINFRLYPDMFPLKRQVQIATDTARRGAARLSGVDAPAFEDNEETFEDLYTRIDGTIAFLKSMKPESFVGAETKTIEMPNPNGTIKLTGINFLMGYAMANFSFHVVTAYNILRHNGVAVGKRDYLGNA